VETEPRVGGAGCCFPDGGVYPEGDFLDVMVVAGEHSDVVVAGYENLVVEPHPADKPRVEFGGFPHGETGLVLPFVVALDLVGLQHVDHDVGMLVDGDVSGHMVHEGLPH
jgi:hypothetical protein